MLRILLINPWIHDFAAYNLWARPLGLLEVSEQLSAYDARLLFIDCADSFEPGSFGTGKYRSEKIPKPEAARSIPRHFKRYGISPEAFRFRLKQFLPVDAVLMTSVMSYWYPGVQETIAIVREEAGKVPVILGGIYPTLYPDHAALRSGADRMYTGPANDALLALLRETGITLRRTREPLPYAKLGLYGSHPFAPLLTSKGCPFHCSYCASNLLSPAFERKATDAIVGRIREFIARGVRDFVFYDDALLFDADRHIKPLLREIINNAAGIRLHAPNGLHARFVDAELAALMKRAGFATIRLSLESVDRDRQDGTGGKVSNSDFERSVHMLRHAGFAKEHLGAYLMYGLPGQPLEEVDRGIAFLRKQAIRIHLAEFSPIKGTPCWNELVRDRVIPPDLDPLLTNNTVYSFLYSGYDPAEVERMKIEVKEYNRS